MKKLLPFILVTTMLLVPTQTYAITWNDIGKWWQTNITQPTGTFFQKTIPGFFQQAGTAIGQGTYEATRIALKPVVTTIFYGNLDFTKRYNELVAAQQRRTPLAKLAPDLKYHQACWVCPHNCFATTLPLFGDHSNQLNYYYAQQLYPLEQHLDIGCRALDINFYEDVYGQWEKFGVPRGQIYMAHSPVSYGPLAIDTVPPLGIDSLLRLRPFSPPRTFASALENIKNFLEQNPQEIVTLVCGDYLYKTINDPQTGKPINFKLDANGKKSFDTEKIDACFKQAGLENLILKPTDWDLQKNAGWPTLGWMVKNNKRFVVFNTYTQTNLAFNLFNQAVTTSFGSIEVHELLNFGSFRSRPSKDQDKYLSAVILVITTPIIPIGVINRDGDIGPSTDLKYIITHLNQVAASINPQQTNSTKLRTLVDDFSKNFGRKPNFLVVDHVEFGDAFAIADGLNNAAIANNNYYRADWFGKFPVPLSPDEQQLFDAVKKNNSAEVTNLLNTNKVSTDITDQHGNTPLHFAVTPAMAELLLAHGAAINAKNDREKTAMDMAKEQKNTSLSLFFATKTGAGNAQK